MLGKALGTILLLTALAVFAWDCVDVPSDGSYPDDYHSLVRFYNALGVTEQYQTPERIDTVLAGTAPFTEGTFTAGLDGAQDTVTTPATGSGTFILVNAHDGNHAHDTLKYSISVRNLSSTILAAHFHRGAAGVIGPVVHTIMGAALVTDTTVSGIWTGGTFSNDFGNLQSGDLYVNFHTVNHPNGEIRGQLYPPPDSFQTRTRIVKRVTIDFLSPAANLGLKVDGSTVTAPGFLSASGYLDIRSGQRVITVSAAGSVDTLHMIDSVQLHQGTEMPISSREVVVATAFMETVPFPVTIPVPSNSKGTMFLHQELAGGSHSSYLHERRVFESVGRSDSALVRLVNAAKFEPDLSINADSADGDMVMSAKFFGASPYVPQGIGSRTLVLVAPPSPPFGSLTELLAANTRRTIVAADSASTVAFRVLADE